MPIPFTCGQCGKSYVVSDGLAGKKAMCKQCGNRMTVPGAPVASPLPVAVARPVASPPRATSVATPVSKPKPVTTREPELEDVYGFNEAPSPLPAAIPKYGASADSESEPDEPVKKKKKKKGFFSSKSAKPASSKSSGMALSPRLLWIGFVLVMGIGGFIWSRWELGSWLEHHFALQDQLVVQLKTVNSEPSARAASPKVNEILQKMIVNLDTNGRKKYSKSMVESMAREFQGRREAVERNIMVEVQRIGRIPGAIPALNFDAAIARLSAIESELAADDAQQGGRRLR